MKISKSQAEAVFATAELKDKEVWVIGEGFFLQPKDAERLSRMELRGAVIEVGEEKITPLRINWHI